MMDELTVAVSCDPNGEIYTASIEGNAAQKQGLDDAITAMIATGLFAEAGEGTFTLSRFAEDPTVLPLDLDGRCAALEDYLSDALMHAGLL